MAHWLSSSQRQEYTKDDMHMTCTHVSLDGHIVAKAKALEVVGPDDSLPQSTTTTTIVDNCARGIRWLYTTTAVFFVTTWLWWPNSLMAGVKDGVKEMELRCWKVFLMHFYAGWQTYQICFWGTSFAIPASNLPLHLVSQITWDRFVNTHGHNIPNILIVSSKVSLVRILLKRPARAVYSLARMANTTARQISGNGTHSQIQCKHGCQGSDGIQMPPDHSASSSQ